MNHNFSSNLKKIREDRQYTQESLAEATNLKRNTIACYETERRECDFDTLLLLANTLHCSTDDLLGNTAETSHEGCIYILTNPSFPEYVKIGYANDVERRLHELNRSECVPFSFRVYATYDVDSKLSDKNVHSIIDRLNPHLRAIEVVKGKKREREFYAMSAEDAYLILEAIAEIHNCSNRLKKWDLSLDEQNAEKEARDIEEESKSRANNFTFSEWQIPTGSILNYRFDETITCEVIDERRVIYNGEKLYLTGVAKRLLGKDRGVCGPDYFIYKGAKLWDIEGRK